MTHEDKNPARALVENLVVTKTALLLVGAITLGATGAACAMPIANLAVVQQIDDLRQQVRVVCNKYGQCYQRRRHRALNYYHRAYPRYYYVNPSYSYDPWRDYGYDWDNYGNYYSDYYSYGNGWDD